jgi:hypothetical protein
MPRKPVISRTMNLLQVTALRTDVKREKVRNEIFILAGTFENNEEILKEVRKLYDTDEMVTSRVKTVREVTCKVSMRPQIFIENAEQIEILPKGEK